MYIYGKEITWYEVIILFISILSLVLTILTLPFIYADYSHDTSSNHNIHIKN